MQLKEELDVSKWLDSRSRESLTNAVRDKISQESKERLLRNDDSPIDYGYSFPGLNCVKESCLKEIRTYFNENGRRPQVADIGAGFGLMTWKLLAAGAKVDAIEMQKPSAQELLKRLKKVNPYFWEEEYLDEILQVYPDNALNLLEKEVFKEKYDFIWISQVIHFLNPNDIIKLKSIFQQVLKPGGKIFIDANNPYTFQSIDKEQIVLKAYNNAKEKNINFPGFLTINAATVINHSLDRIVAQMLISVYDSEKMKKYAIPFETNGYGENYRGKEVQSDNETNLYKVKEQYPNDICSINRFHMIMNLIDEKTAPLVFEQAGFKCDSFLFNGYTNETLFPPINPETPCLLGVYLEKTKEPLELSTINPKVENLAKHSIFSEDPHKKLVLELEQTGLHKKTVNSSFFESIQVKDYGLALRKASAVANLDLVKILLKYQRSLDIPVNGQSKNQYTALDWINSNKNAEYITKERIISLLVKNGAQSGHTENTIKNNCI